MARQTLSCSPSSRRCYGRVCSRLQRPLVLGYSLAEPTQVIFSLTIFAFVKVNMLLFWHVERASLRFLVNIQRKGFKFIKIALLGYESPPHPVPSIPYTSLQVTTSFASEGSLSNQWANFKIDLVRIFYTFFLLSPTIYLIIFLL